jgi:hypothetical protein
MLVIAGWLPAQQTAPPGTLTLPQAVENSLKNYPSIRVSKEQINAAGAAIQLARTAYLPRVDALAQVNRATRNNVFGLLLPQSVIPSMSGPVIGSNNLGPVRGSAVGGLVTWEPFDFGLRSANIASANDLQRLSGEVFSLGRADPDQCPHRLGRRKSRPPPAESIPRRPFRRSFLFAAPQVDLRFPAAARYVRQILL